MEGSNHFISNKIMLALMRLISLEKYQPAQQQSLELEQLLGHQLHQLTHDHQLLQLSDHRLVQKALLVSFQLAEHVPVGLQAFQLDQLAHDHQLDSYTGSKKDRDTWVFSFQTSKLNHL